MNNITKNIINIENNVISNVASRIITERYKREVTEALPSRAIDTIQNPSEACLLLLA
jgi:hypothetical protein